MLDELFGKDSFSMKEALIKLTRGERAFSKEALQEFVYRSLFYHVEQEKEQHRFNMELVYIQDITKIRDGETAIGVSCPHCGAPIAGLGDRVCPYCGGAVEPVTVRVWELHRIEEV